MNSKKMVHDRILVSALFSAALLLAGAAQGAEYKVDPSHSNIGFTIRHIVSNVSGEFREAEGAFSFDPAKPETAKLSAKVKVASVNTNNEKRDGHLKSEEFFDAAKHPEMTFVAKKLSKAGGAYKLAGDLTIRGVTKPVTFDVDFLGEATDPWGMERAGFTAKTKINRKDFGVNWNKALDKGGFVLGDDVTISLNIEATRNAPKTAKQ